jgi:hypothetical protein
MTNSKKSRRNKRNPLDTLECNDREAIVRVNIGTKEDTQKLNEALDALAAAGIPYEWV